ALTNLTALEIEELVTLYDVTTCVQRAQMVNRIRKEIERYIAELGSEGPLVQMQLEELASDIENEGLLIVRDDYHPEDDEGPEEVWQALSEWSAEYLVDLSLIARGLGYGAHLGNLDMPVTPRAFRVLTKVPRLPMPVIENLVQRFRTLSDIAQASLEELDSVVGIGESRDRTIKYSLIRQREQALLERHLY